MSEGLDPGRVLAAVARVAGVEPADLRRAGRPDSQRRPRGDSGWVVHPRTVARAAAAWLLRHRCGMSYRELAARLRCNRKTAWWLVWRRRTHAAPLVAAIEQALQRPAIDVEDALRRAREDAAGPMPRSRA